jgi:hypothetical protein
MTLTRLLAVPLVILAGVACAAGGPPRKPAGKVSPDLLELHEAYQAAESRGEKLAGERSRLRVVDGRVLIEAVAAGDTRALEADLVALGLRRQAAFGRIVSGELPIEAIPRLESLTSLALVRPSMPSRGPAPRPTPDPR